ncbi:MAG: glycosyltransferase [Planctomycetota bacterium]|jgi:glycosyltransferase involved in cell wall biosynthesis|nr:glycosyltransferase [Planctomycetota bacterium]
MGDMPTIHLVHEWLAERAGSEQVVEAMLRALPVEALHALVYFPDEYRDSPIAGVDKRLSFFDRSRFLRKRFRTFLGLMPFAVEQYDLRAAEVVISSHHACAKGVLTSSRQLHISYVHSPMRYAWELYHDYLEGSGLNRGIRGLLAKWTLSRLRQWDRLAADRVDLFLANSETVARRIRKVYRRPAAVLHPPVQVDRFRADRPREDFYCTVSRLVPYKRVDLLARVCSEMGRKLVIIGNGPDRARVEAAVGPTVTFLGNVDDATVQDHLERCRAFLFASEEDFGIVPVEAMAAGAPVVAYARGGAGETVVDGETGVLVESQSVDSFRSGIERFESSEFSAEVCRNRAETFSEACFRQRLEHLVPSAWDAFQQTGPWLPGREPDAAAWIAP